MVDHIRALSGEHNCFYSKWISKPDSYHIFLFNMLLCTNCYMLGLVGCCCSANGTQLVVWVLANSFTVKIMLLWFQQ
jgi:hypothetical protein